MTRTAATRRLKLARREETGSIVEEQKFPLTAAWCSGAAPCAAASPLLAATRPQPCPHQCPYPFPVLPAPSMSMGQRPLCRVLALPAPEAAGTFWGEVSELCCGWAERSRSDFGGRRNSGTYGDLVCGAGGAFSPPFAGFLCVLAASPRREAPEGRAAGAEPRGHRDPAGGAGRGPAGRGPRRHRAPALWKLHLRAS